MLCLRVFFWVPFIHLARSTSVDDDDDADADRIRHLSKLNILTSSESGAANSEVLADRFSLNFFLDLGAYKKRSII